MSIEDFVLRFEGLDPAKIKQGLDDVSHLAGVIKAEVEKFKALLDTELPRIERLIANVQSQIAAYEANQRRFGS